MKWRAILLICILLSSIFSILSVSNEQPSPVKAIISIYTPHAPIDISSNGEFLGSNATTGISWGSGTASDPYIIRGWDIDASGGYWAALYIGYSNVFFKVEDCYLHDASSYGICIRSSNGFLVNNTCSHNIKGIMLENVGTSPSNNILVNNTCSYNDQDGICLYNGCVGNILLNNNCSNNQYNGISLQSSSYNTVSNNNCSNNRYYGVSIDNTNSRNNEMWNNTFYHNNGGGNSYNSSHIQAFDFSGHHLWNSLSGYGNYWRDWTTPDSVAPFGIVDNPYNISGGAGAKDYYPLTASPGDCAMPISTIFLSGTLGSNGWYISSVNVTFAFVMKYRLDGGYWSDHHGYWLNVFDTGNHILDFYSVDFALNTESIQSVTFKIDTTPPTGNIRILNCTEPYVNSTSITLNLTAIDDLSGVDKVRFSNEKITWTSWQNFSSKKDWTLLSGDGRKFVYYEIIDKAGVNSTIYWIDVTLDTTPPTISFEKVNGAIFTNRSRTINWTGTDATTGIDHYEYSFDNMSFISIGQTKHISIDSLATDGMHNLTVHAIDEAGNVAQRILSFVVETRLQLNLTCDVPTAAFGSGVQLTGYACYKVNRSKISDLPLMLYYSVTSGATWNEIASVKTGLNGDYSVLWLPTATGLYQLKVAWAGNTSHHPCEEIINLAVTPYLDKYVFAVQSNSNISALKFDSSKRELSFTINDQSNSTGYAIILISKDLVKNTASLKIYIDGNKTSFQVGSTADSWIIYISFNNTSSHNNNGHHVVTSLGSIDDGSTSSVPLAIGISIAAGTLLAVILLARRKKKKEFESPPKSSTD